MPFARSILALAVATLSTMRAAEAQSLTPPVPAAPRACSEHGAVTLVGRVPMPRRGPSVLLQIAPDSVATEALAKDMVTAIKLMKPLESHMSGLEDYSNALATIPIPQPTFADDDTLDTVAAAYAEQDAHRQMTALASNELSEVAVGSKGEFACRGVTAGSYIFLLTESETITPNESQQYWGRSLPNETLYVMRFVVPKAPKAPTLHLPASFSMVARFKPVGA